MDVQPRVEQDSGMAPTMPMRTEVTWIVLHPDQHAVLVLDDLRPGLPSRVLPGDTWLGDAQVFTAALAELGLDAVVLGCCELVDDHDAHMQRMTVVVTLRAGSVPTPPRTRWTKREEVPALLPPGIGTMQSGRPPWEAPGWFSAAEEWLHDQLAVLGRSVTGRVEQRRCWELSTVLNVATDAGTVWLKASAGSSLFANEGSIMALLADWFPAHVPAPLAWDDSRRFVLLDELGPTLGRNAPIETQEQVLADFGRLQAASAERLAALRAVGLIDRGPSRLAQQAADWLQDLDSTAQLPGIDPETWLTTEEAAVLRAALPLVVALCDQLAVGPVPSLTLLHGDLHMGNVAAEPAVLFDWTDACIGHPFFDLVTALQDAPDRPGLSTDDETRIRLRDAYLSAWPDHGRGRLAEAWRAVEILGPLHHAISYRAIAAGCTPPVDQDMASATAGWLRSVLAALQMYSG